MRSQFDFPNFVGLLFLVGGVTLWTLAVFQFLEFDIVQFLIFTVLGFIMAISGGYLLKPPGAR